MSYKNLVFSVSFAAVLSFCLSGCVTESELVRGSIGRYVEGDKYRNPLKHYQLKLPPEQIWKFKNYPEFDLTFNRFDGYAQLFVVGTRKLIRRDFPEGFQTWIMNRLKTSDISIESRNLITEDDYREFHIYLDAKFMILPRDKFGVNRKVALFLFEKENHWVGIAYVAPQEYFDTYLNDIKGFADTLTFI